MHKPIKKKLSGPGEEIVLLDFKHGNAKDGKSLEDLACETHTQMVEKYLNGVREKWHPERLLVLGAGFKGKELAVFTIDNSLLIHKGTDGAWTHPFFQ